MPRLNPAQVAAATKPSRTPAQLANDARLRARAGKPKAQIRSEDFAGARTEANISATGKTEVTHRQIEVIPESKAARKAAEEAFMNEYVVVLVEQSDDPDAPVFLQSGHNGVDQYLQRGVPQRIKRRFLYSLIAGKKTAQASTFGKDGSGKEFNRLTGRTSTTHRISLIEDTAEGRKAFSQWMQLPG